MNAQAKICKLAFAIPENVQLTELILFSECLELANRLLGARLFDYKPVDLGGTSQGNTNETSITVSECERIGKIFDVVAVFGSNRGADKCNSESLNWLRRQARHGALVGSVANGVHTLARAGLLSGRFVSLPQSSVAAFRELHPTVEISPDIYLIDDRGFSCCGGVATIDLAIQIITAYQGHELASHIADGFAYDVQTRRAQRKETLLENRLNRADQPLSAALKLMKTHIESPLPIKVIAKSSGISPRHLERQFTCLFSTTPRNYYMKLRLWRARSLLLETTLSVTEISHATGFRSPANFAKNYRSVYGKRPSEERSKNWAIEASKNLAVEYLGASMNCHLI